MHDNLLQRHPRCVNLSHSSPHQPLYRLIILHGQRLHLTRPLNPTTTSAESGGEGVLLLELIRVTPLSARALALLRRHLLRHQMIAPVFHIELALSRIEKALIGSA